MKYYINFINLERDEAKKMNMEKILKNQNLDYEIVVGYDFKKDKLPEYEIKNYTMKPTIKEMYITFSHIKLFEKYVNYDENDDDFVVVMEDDVSFKYIKDFDKEIEECLLKIPSDWTYINLHCSNKFMFKKNIELYKNNIYYQQLNNDNIQKDNSLVCSLIKIKLIKKIINLIKSDRYVFDFHNKHPTPTNIIKIAANENGYYYTKPIISVVDDNINTLGIPNPHDYMSNKLIAEYWKENS